MSLPILMLHALDRARSPITLDPATFAARLDWLDARGYEAPSLAAGLRADADAAATRRRLIITFDDGDRSVYEHAFPLLARHGFSATIFLVSGYIGATNRWPGQPASIPTRPLMDWSQIREMARHGFEFGAHTHSHPRLDLLPPDEAEREIVEGRDRLEQGLGAPIRTFAYPYGATTPQTREVVAREFDCAVGTRLALARAEDDRHLLPRLDVLAIAPGPLFALLDGPLLAPYLALRRPLRAVGERLRRRASGAGNGADRL